MPLNHAIAIDDTKSRLVFETVKPVRFEGILTAVLPLEIHHLVAMVLGAVRTPELIKWPVLILGVGSRFSRGMNMANYSLIHTYIRTTIFM